MQTSWITSTTALGASLILSTASLGCVSPRQTPPENAIARALPSPPPPRADHERHVYRFEFVLTTNEAGVAPSSTTFTLSLEDGQRGEIVLGKNVALSTLAPPSSGSPMAPSPMASPRQDVGMKVAASFRSQGDDVLLDANIEMSTFDPPSTIRKVVARGNALASTGKPAVVTMLEDDHKRYQLSVTPTKLR